MGVEAFAERARRELLATGETVRKRSIGGPEELTAQEAQIARLVGQGHTNPEIGAELFLSPRTVEWHLRKVFAQARRQLPQGTRCRPAQRPAPGARLGLPHPDGIRGVRLRRGDLHVVRA